MEKRKAFYFYSELTARQARGDYWFSQAEKYFNLQKTLIYAASLKILFPVIPNWILILFFIAANLGVEIIKYGIGLLDEKWGLWKWQNLYQSKKAHISPWQVGAEETLKGICKKMGVKHQFSDI